MREFYLVPRKIAEHYAASSPNKEVNTSIKSVNGENEAGSLNQREVLSTAEDKCLTTALLPGSSSKQKREKVKHERMKEKDKVKGGGRVKKRRKSTAVKKKKRRSIYIEPPSYYRRENIAARNPPLDALINKKVPQEGKRHYVKSLVSYFENNPNIL